MTLKRERYEFMLTKKEAYALAGALKMMREPDDQIRFIISASLSDDEEHAMSAAITAYAETVIKGFGRQFHVTEVDWHD